MDEVGIGWAADGGEVYHGLQEVRPAGLGSLQRRRVSPFPDLGVGAAHEDVGHAPAAELGGSGVLRVFEEPARERLLDRRLVVDRPRQEAGDGVDDDERRQLTAGEDVVTDRELEVEQVADPLVDALVARADEDEVRPRGELRRSRLAEDLAARVEEDRRRSGMAEGVEGVGDRLGAHDHARSPAIGRVVNAAMTTETPRPEVVEPHVHQPALAGSAGDALRQRALEHRGEQADDVDLERHAPAVPFGVRGPLPWRDQRGRRRGTAPAAPRPAPGAAASTGGASRSRTASSTMISPRSGANVVTTSRTAGRSNSPTGPPRTT